jgi:hypothetical protein
MRAMGKRSSFLFKVETYARKKFYNIGIWSYGLAYFGGKSTTKQVL